MSDPKSKILNIRLSERELAQLAKEAALLDLPRSELARRKILETQPRQVRIVYPQAMGIIQDELIKIRTELADALVKANRMGASQLIAQAFSQNLTALATLERAFYWHLQQQPGEEITPLPASGGPEELVAEEPNIPAYLLKGVESPQK